MRIGLICHAGFGGSAKVAVGLAGQMAEAGHRVHVFCRRNAAFLEELPLAVSAHLVEGAAPYSRDRLDLAWPAADLNDLTSLIVDVARTEGLDVLHVHYALPFALAAAGLRTVLGDLCPRLIATLHGTDVSVYGRDPMLGPQLDGALRSLDALTTVSTSHAQLARQVFGWTRPPEVIPNFVDLTRWRPHHAGRVRPRRPRIAHVSNFRPVKATESVARVFLTVRHRMASTLWLIGDGADMAAVDEILDDGGVNEDIRHFGLRPDVHRILPRADLLLMTSRSESFCLAALEAQACGVPVVAPRVGGIPEVVDDGVTGDLFDPGDEEAASAAVLSILQDPERAALLAKRGVERAGMFASDKVALRYLALYRRVVAAPTDARPVGGR